MPGRRNSGQASEGPLSCEEFPRGPQEALTLDQRWQRQTLLRGRHEAMREERGRACSLSPCDDDSPRPLTRFTFLAPHGGQLDELVTVNRSLLVQVLAVKLSFCEPTGADRSTGLQ